MHDRERLGAYLERIGYTGPVAPTLEVLRGMHTAHFYTVPFENLSIARGERIVVDPARNYEKVVERQRGGFCIELTGLFAWALREIGFRVDLLGARVVQSDGNLGAERSHMALRVHVPDHEDDPWIADVGFGGQVAAPLRLHDPAPQLNERRQYIVRRDGDRWSVTCDELWQTWARARTSSRKSRSTTTASRPSATGCRPRRTRASPAATSSASPSPRGG
jgi:arylamine N-acetyltransferase